MPSLLSLAALQVKFQEKTVIHFSQREIQEVFPSCISISFSVHLLCEHRPDHSKLLKLALSGEAYPSGRDLCGTLQSGKVTAPQGQPGQATPVPSAWPAVNVHLTPLYSASLAGYQGEEKF